MDMAGKEAIEAVYKLWPWDGKSKSDIWDNPPEVLTRFSFCRLVKNENGTKKNSTLFQIRFVIIWRKNLVHKYKGFAKNAEF